MSRQSVILPGPGCKRRPKIIRICDRCPSAAHLRHRTPKYPHLAVQIPRSPACPGLHAGDPPSGDVDTCGYSSLGTGSSGSRARGRVRARSALLARGRLGLGKELTARLSHSPPAILASISAEHGATTTRSAHLRSWSEQGRRMRGQGEPRYAVLDPQSSSSPAWSACTMPSSESCSSPTIHPHLARP